MTQRIGGEELSPPDPGGPGAKARDLLWLTLAACLLFFVSLGSRDLWNPNEPIYGRAVAEMADTESWLIPTVNGKIFAEKPILYFWTALASSKVLGEVNELSLRIPSAVAGVASVLLTYLLVIPYAGRRRALLTAALFATLYQVFWASRSVQMDILVLASALGVLVPVTRMLDFGAPAARAWALAGVAAGLGFTAKGPVTLIVPGLVIFAYAASCGRLRALFRPQLAWGVGLAVAVSLPWYLVLWLRGETAFLFEVLIRQNFTRFVEAWDHQQPWWYYLEYLWLDYAPWSWLLPAAWLSAARDPREGKLDRLSWIWIFGLIAFFSLSESKRAPYILPIAPAVAALAAGVIDRWTLGAQSRRARLATVAALSAISALFLLTGAALLTPWLEVPAHLLSMAKGVGVVLAACGLLAVGCLAMARRRPSLSPAVLLSALTTLYLVAAIWVFPAVNSLKSARTFADRLGRQLAQEAGAEGGTEAGPLASYRFWDWRAGYSYYARRSIPNLETPTDLASFWLDSSSPHVLVEGEHEAELKQLIPGAILVLRQKIGSRTAYLYAKRQAADALTLARLDGAGPRGPSAPIAPDQPPPPAGGMASHSTRVGALAAPRAPR